MKSDVIPVMNNGKVVCLKKPPQWTSIGKRKISEMSSVQDVVRYTFADRWIGHSTQATMSEVKNALARLEKTYLDDGYVAWSDIWALINKDYIPCFAVCGGEDQAGQIADGYSPYDGEYALGWSKSFIEEMEGSKDDPYPDPLTFRIIQDKELHIYWISANYKPIEGYLVY